HLGRANGLMQFGYGVAEVGAPLAAGVLLLYMQIWTLILVDVLTFVVANVTLLLLSIPRTAADSGEDEPTGRLREDLTYGLRFLRAKPGLLMLLVLFATLNFLASLAVVAVTPMVLSFGDEAALGTVTAVGGAGIIVGGLLMTAWGGTRRRVVGLLAATAVAGLFLALYGVRPSVLLVAFGAFGFFFCLPIINASSGAIWQASVPPAVQGRVFAVRRVLAQASGPIAFIVGGLVIDRWLSPLLAEPGGARDVFGPVFGTGQGRGIGLLFVAMGVLMVVVAAVGAASPALRGAEAASGGADEPTPAAVTSPAGSAVVPESTQTADAAPQG
ncbi:MAG: MFS transporter, partial [Hamadaea sp.]|nr:MFS transporter [Hamadaea sp.]